MSGADLDTASLIREELVDRAGSAQVAYNGFDGLAAILEDPLDLVFRHMHARGDRGSTAARAAHVHEPRFGEHALWCLSRRWVIMTVSSRGGGSAPTITSSSPWTMMCLPR